MATEETTITELELAEEVLADMVIPVDTSTDTKSVSLKQLRAWLGSSLPTGFILPAVGRIDDERFSLLDGKTLSKQGTYGAFCAKVEEQVQASNWFACSEEEYNADLLAYGQCGKFVIGTDYVRIPTITRFIGATITLSEIGKTYKESLPKPFANIGDGLASYVGSGGTNAFVAGPYVQAQNYTSDTYQDGAKVQPDHTKFPYYMVISTEGQTANVEIDINKVYEDLNLKANSDLSNVASVSQTFKEQSVSWGMPDYSAGVSLSTAQGSEYIAPKNGIILCNAMGDNMRCYCYIDFYDENDNLITRIGNDKNSTAGSGSLASLVFPINAGQRVKVNAFAGATKIYNFYPLKGVN